MSPSLPCRPLGQSGLMVSALGMGCGRLGSIRHDPVGKASSAAVAAALDSGITFFDTADSYAGGRSERILGQAVARRRDRVVIASKCGILKTPVALIRAIESTRRSAASRGPAHDGEQSWQMLQTRRCYSPAYIVRAAEASLRRLRMEYLDVLLLHSPPRSVLADESVSEAMGKLKADGKIRLWGVSALTESDAQLAMTIPGIDCIEVRLSVSRPESATVSIAQASKRGLGVIARQPFDSGRAIQNSKVRVRSVDRGPSVASWSQLLSCLQFAMRVPGVSTVIAGMTHPEHVRANVGASMGEPPSPLALETVRQNACGH